MKKINLILLSFCFALLLNAQVSKTATITPGGLSTALNLAERASITKLTLTGTIDARDFKTMRDTIPLLAELDLSGVTVAAYTGPLGTSTYNTSYYADEIPENCFMSNWQGKTSLTSIVLTGSITSIGAKAFYNCSGLKTIYTLGTNPIIGISV